MYIATHKMHALIMCQEIVSVLSTQEETELGVIFDCFHAK